MDIFGLLDQAVRGTVDFIYDLVRTTVTLVTKPIAGPLQLWRDYNRPDAQQVSPLTYLTLIFVFVAFAYAGAEPTGTAGPGINVFASFASLLTTGSITNALIPLLAGAVVAAVLIELLLRLVGMLVPCGPRRERFIGVMEYEIGVFLLVLSASVLIQNLTTEDVGMAIAMAPFYAAAFIMAVHFYVQLRRNPRWYRYTRSIPRNLRHAWRVGPRAWVSWLIGRLTHLPGTLKFLVVGYFKLFVGFFLLIPPFLIIVPGLLAREYATNWLLEEQRPTATVTLLDLRCDFATRPMTASAVAWNSSSKPAANWLGNLNLELMDSFGQPSGPLKWTARWAEPRKGDLLKPGEAAVLGGPLAWVAGNPGPDWLDDNLHCRAVRTGGQVRVRSEGNAVNPPTSAD